MLCLLVGFYGIQRVYPRGFSGNEHYQLCTIDYVIDFVRVLRFVGKVVGMYMTNSFVPAVSTWVSVVSRLAQ